MNPLFQAYQDAPWLVHREEPASDETKKCIVEVMAAEAEYPFAPGNELEYLDDSTPASMSRTDYKLARGLNLYAYCPNALDPAEKRVIYYIHGGGFMRGNGKWCRMNAITQVKYLGLPVYCGDYRYIPEHKYPAGLDDVEAGWNYLVDVLGIDPQNIIVSGESAGGTYAMALTVRLKRQGRKLPLKLVVLSGYLDMALEGESYLYNIGKDSVFSADDLPNASFYTDEEDVKQPEISPLYADFTDFPPAFFAAEDTEIFASDALRAADKMHKAGIAVKGYFTHGLVHAFPFEVPDVPESQAVFAAIKEFLM